MFKQFVKSAVLGAIGLGLASCSDDQDSGSATQTLVSVTPQDFRCISDMTPVRGFFVDNLTGGLDGTIAVAQSETGGVYPVGSVVQLVPTEAMVKREKGFDPATKDWEFFELIVSKDGTTINTRGSADVVNRFGGNCLECHAQAEPQWDLICETDHGCDPIPLTPAMTRGIQKTDPRCEPVALTDEEMEALQLLKEMTGG